MNRMPNAAESAGSSLPTGLFRPDPADAARRRREAAADLGDRYELREYLGAGAFASVWRAVDLAEGRPVAVKRFEPRPGHDRNYHRELAALFRLDHPRIVRIINLLEAGSGARYLLLEFCAGGSLRTAIASARRAGMAVCPPERAAELAGYLAEGLAEAHRRGLAHHDLKPENVLFERAATLPFGGDAGAKLADFGMARIFPRDDRQDAALSGGRLAALSGSPAYMAPERFGGESGPAGDLYSLGVLLYELLHGRRPFEGPPEQLAMQHLSATPALSPALPSSWRRVLAALLSKRPADRPGADEVAARMARLAKEADEPPVPVLPEAEAQRLRDAMSTLGGLLLRPAVAAPRPGGETDRFLPRFDPAGRAASAPVVPAVSPVASASRVSSRVPVVRASRKKPAPPSEPTPAVAGFFDGFAEDEGRAAAPVAPPPPPADRRPPVGTPPAPVSAGDLADGIRWE